MLDASPGASGTFGGISGRDTVTVVTTFANGADSVAFQNIVL